MDASQKRHGVFNIASLSTLARPGIKWRRQALANFEAADTEMSSTVKAHKLRAEHYATDISLPTYPACASQCKNRLPTCFRVWRQGTEKAGLVETESGTIRTFFRLFEVCGGKRKNLNAAGPIFKHGSHVARRPLGDDGPTLGRSTPPSIHSTRAGCRDPTCAPSHRIASYRIARH